MNKNYLQNPEVKEIATAFLKESIKTFAVGDTDVYWNNFLLSQDSQEIPVEKENVQINENCVKYELLSEYYKRNINSIPIQKEEPVFEIIAYKYDGIVHTKKEQRVNLSNGKVDIYFIWETKEHALLTPNSTGQRSIMSEEFFTNSNNASIQSIKQLSTGKVFSVGDKVIWNWKTNPKPFETISGIDKEGRILLEGRNIDFDLKVLLQNWNIRHCEEPKPEVLFTTEDGVEMTDREQIVYGLSVDFEGEWILAVKTIFKNTDEYIVKWFSSKETRDKYILENKPLLSLKEIMDWDNTSGGIEDIIQLAQKKLKEE